MRTCVEILRKVDARTSMSGSLYRLETRHFDAEIGEGGFPLTNELRIR